MRRTQRFGRALLPHQVYASRKPRKLPPALPPYGNSVAQPFGQQHSCEERHHSHGKFEISAQDARMNAPVSSAGMVIRRLGRIALIPVPSTNPAVTT